VAAATLLRALGVQQVEAQYYVLRGLSAFGAVLVLLLGWCGTRLLFGSLAATTTGAMLALHPQFAIVGVTASPDAFANACGAVLWLLAALVLRRRVALAALLGLWAVAGIAALVRRMAIPLISYPLLLTVAGLALSRSRDALVSVTLAVGAALAAAWTLYALHPEPILVAWHWANRDGIHLMRAVRTPVDDPSYFWTFSSGIYQSFWLTAGWMRYAAPSWWYCLVASISVAAVIGLPRAISAGTTEERFAFAVAIVVVVVQVAAVYGFYLPLRAGSQGRYLFPVVVPALLLIYSGFMGVWSQSRRREARLLLLVVVALADATAWAIVIIPTYTS
jgi:4-amino-4-deoxy-L-arabinose transferase-like glycosyltransferase